LTQLFEQFGTAVDRALYEDLDAELAAL